MFSKNNRQMNDKKQGEIITRYTIKRFSFGAASVAVACGIYFANGATAEAQDYSGVTSSVDYEVVAEASDQSLAPEVNLNQASEIDSLGFFIEEVMCATTFTLHINVVFMLF